jgi:hypothetical protein
VQVIARKGVTIAVRRFGIGLAVIEDERSHVADGCFAKERIMRRMGLMVVAMSVLMLAAQAAMAQTVATTSAAAGLAAASLGHHGWAHGYYHGYYYAPSVVVAPAPVVVAPPAVVPAYPAAVYAQPAYAVPAYSAYPPYGYYGQPGGSVYIGGPRIGIGVRF